MNQNDRTNDSDRVPQNGSGKRLSADASPDATVSAHRISYAHERANKLLLLERSHDRGWIRSDTYINTGDAR